MVTKSYVKTTLICGPRKYPHPPEGGLTIGKFKQGGAVSKAKLEFPDGWEEVQSKNPFMVFTQGYKFVLNMTHDVEYFVFSNRNNCEKESAKVFRQYYRRPYFLPPMAEAVEGNWFLVSSGENQSLNVSFLVNHHCDGAGDSK